MPFDIIAYCWASTLSSTEWTPLHKMKTCRSVPFHFCSDLLPRNFSPWFQVRIISIPPPFLSPIHHSSKRSNDKAPERGRCLICEVNQTGLCLPSSPSPPPPVSPLTRLAAYPLTSKPFCLVACLHVCLTHLSVSPSDRWPFFPSLCQSLCLSTSVYLNSSPRLSLCSLTWPLSLAFCRAWLVDWLIFGLIRFTYHRDADKHTWTHTCPHLLAWTPNRPLFSTTDRCFSLI